MFITRPATTAPNLSSSTGNGASMVASPELRTVAQIRNAAALKTNKSVKGVSPLTAMNSLRRLAEEAHLKEQSGDLRAALYQLIQVTVLLNFVTESHEYKLEAQKGRHGTIYQLMQDFLRGPFGEMMKSIDSIQRTLQAEEEAAQADTSSELDGSLNRRQGASLAERLKALQGSGMQADMLGRKIQRPPSQNFRPQSPPVNIHGATIPSRGPTPAPRGPTPGPYTRRASVSFVPPIPPPSPKPNGGVPMSYASPVSATSTHSRSSVPPPLATAPGTSPSARQFVPVSSFGPPSPTHSNGSSPEEDEIQIPRVRDHPPPVRSPSDFSRTFPPINELNEMEPSMFPSVPKHSPSSSISKMTSPINGVNGHHATNGLPWKKFASPSLGHESRPASTPIPIKRQSGGSRPNTPGHFVVGSPGGAGAYPSQPSPRANGFVTAEPTPARVDLPLTNAITPQKLNSLLETRGLNILLLDVRNRESFEKERINHDAIVCIEPIILGRAGINSSVIEGAMSISPSTEQVLFKNRSRFDLIIMYDDRSSTMGASTSPVSALSKAIFENEFHRPLKRPPMLLIGGLKAWRDIIGEDGVLRRVSPTSSAGSLPTNGHIVPNATGSSTSGTSASEEETFLYDRPAEIKAQEIKPQHTGSDYSTETPGSKLLGRRMLPKLSSLSGASRSNGSPSEAHAPTLVSNGPIQYPSFPAPFSPPPGTEPTPPQAASINPYQSSRKRGDYSEQAYSGSAAHTPRPIDYPQLSGRNVLAPPPAAATAATMATTRLEPPRRLAQPSAPSYPPPNSAPIINSEYPVLYWANNEIGVSGLKNLGNTCYMNSILQCLSAVAPFARFFVDGRWKNAVNMLNPLGTKGKFTEAYARLLVDMWQADQGALIPVPFRKSVCVYAPQFADSNQHDAQEFMIFLLDGLHEDLNRVLQRQQVETRPEREAELEVLSTQIASEQEWQMYRMTNNSIIVDYFQGQFRNRMECMTCHKTSTTYNTFMHLSVPVPDGRHTSRVTLQACLDAFVAQEMMEKNDAWNCPNCKTLRKATKSLTLCRLPPVLLIHLKRFSFKGPFTEKLETLVEFPLTNLDLTNYMPPPLPPGLNKESKALYGRSQILSPEDPRRQLPPYKYDLFGVTNHFGTLSNGHYTAFVSSGQGWKYCDDSRITRADRSAVVTKAAYILFYKRTH